MTSIQERNQEILQMRKEGVARREVARQFGITSDRISQIEERDQADKSMDERRGELRGDIRASDDVEKLWPVNDLADAIGLFGATKNRLLDHFAKTGRGRISFRELMDMCLKGPLEGFDFMVAPLLRVRGIGRKGFWLIVNGLTTMDLGSRGNEEWQKRLIKVKQEAWIVGATPYSSTRQ
jgi:hypothetical protein